MYLPRHSIPTRPSGAALVLVLSALALVAFLAVVVLSFIRQENRASRTAAELTELRTLAGLPEKLVINQIRLATRSLNADLNDRKNWTSQPGLIRVFGTSDMDSSTGRSMQHELYKLYSSSQMALQVTPGTPPLEEELNALRNAAENLSPGQTSAMVVDLNEPVLVSPRRSRGGRTVSRDAVAHFPIMHPGALGLVDGFENPLAAPTRAPMPVQWLYVLRDGTVSPAQGQADDATVKVPGASEKNPVIGRIAFWADDDSSRLNINTASEAAPWTPPVTSTPGDAARAENLPARGEHYRLPGHPAFTSLSPVFRHFKGGPLPSATGGQAPDPEATPRQREKADPRDDQTWASYVRKTLNRLPRSPVNDSRSGSRAGTQPPTQPVEQKQQRLFTSADELLFDPAREQNDDLTQDQIERIRFFLTTHSRSPETNLFNQPKLSLWPIQQDAGQRHELDQKLMLASSLPASPSGLLYAFQRAEGFGGSQPASQDPDQEMGPTNRQNGIERNQQLFAYLRRMAEQRLPGFGTATQLEKYGEASTEQLILSMLDYLRWGVNPASPQGGVGADPLRPEYRYLEPASGVAGADGATSYSAVPLRVPSEASPELPLIDLSGQPLDKTIKAYGRYPIISEVALVFAATEAKDQNENVSPDTNPQNGFADTISEITAYLVFEHMNVAPGTPAMSAALRYRIVWPGLQMTASNGAFTFGDATTIDAEFPPPRSPLPPTQQRLYFGSAAAFAVGGGSSFDMPSGPYLPLASQFYYVDAGSGRNALKLFPSEVPRVGDPIEDRRFCGSVAYPIPIKMKPPKPGEVQEEAEFEFNPGPLTITVFPGNLGETADLTDPPLQEYVFQFPPARLRLPKYKLLPGDDGSRPLKEKLLPTNHPKRQETGPDSHLNNNPWIEVVSEGDVVRSMELDAAGDSRLAAGRQRLDASLPMYAPAGIRDGRYNDSQHYQVHSLRDDNWMPSGQPPQIGDSPPPSLTHRPTHETAGTLLPGFLPLNAVPAVPPFVSSVANNDSRFGDFDNGPGRIQDGPYIGFPGISNAATEQADRGWMTRGGTALDEDGTTFAPWGQISSAFAFGSLPTSIYGIPSNGLPRPWQTLLLCPHPASRTTAPDREPEWQAGSSTKADHFGFSFPRDHLWLEQFWMPVVEPDHLSSGYATSGKVNLNHQMIPFTWIHRTTALHGALNGVRITALHHKHTDYKDPTGPNRSVHYAVNHKETLKGLSRRFDSRGIATDVYRSPSEVCEVFLVPERLPDGDYGGEAPEPPTDWTQTLDWWQGDLSPTSTQRVDAFEPTGDNTRESPYAQLYPRLCTRSNVFTIHYRVQLIRSSRVDAEGAFTEGNAEILGEQRGSATVERYLDPNDPALRSTDFLQADDVALDDLYRYRVVNRHTFAP